MTDQGQQDKAESRFIDISESLFNSFRQTINYGFEDTYVTKENPFETEMRDAFFTDLYVSRLQDETEISTWMTTHANDLGLVVGVQGCGKSTILKKIRNTIDEELYPILCINIRNIYEALGKLAPEHWKPVVDEALKGELTARFFKKERIDHFFGYFLYEVPEAEQIFLEELNSISRLHKLSLATEHSEDNPHIDDEQAWFEASRMKNSDLVKISGSISMKLGLKHYLIASRIVSPQVKHFIIILDNVDCVPRQHQYYLYEIADEIRAIHLTSCNVVIATRKETCHPPSDVCNTSASPIVRLGFYSPEVAEERILTSKEFFKILTKRLNYFRDRSIDNLAEAEIIIQLSNNLRQIYKEGGLLQKLANQSIRDALRYHCDYLLHLLCIYPSEELKKNFSGPYAKTIMLSSLYGWLTKYSNVLKKQHLNLVDLLRYCRERNFIGTKGCDISYLILACVYNFRRNNGRNPLVSELIYRFQPLGYNRNDVLDALYNLWDLHKIDFGHIISLYQHPLPESYDQINEGAEIEMNYRGEVLIRIISVSFMFITRLLYDTNIDFFYARSDKKKIGRFYDIIHVPVHLKNNTKFLFELADLHTLELHKIRTGYTDKSWFRLYLRDFGIDHKLQIERIIESNEGFLSGLLGQNSPLNNEMQKKIKFNIKLQFLLGQLYRQEVESYTIDNASNIQVLYFRSIYDEIIRYPSKMADAAFFKENPKFKRGINKFI